MPDCYPAAKLFASFAKHIHKLQQFIWERKSKFARVEISIYKSWREGEEGVGGVSCIAYTCNLLKIHWFWECTKSSLNWSGYRVNLPLHYSSSIHHAYEVPAKTSMTRRNMTDCFCSLPNFKLCCEMMPLHFKPMSDLDRFLVAELRFLKHGSVAKLFFCMTEYGSLLFLFWTF